MVVSGNNIAPHSDAKIPLSKKLSQKVQHAFLFDKLKTNSLISIEQLYMMMIVLLFF